MSETSNRSEIGVIGLLGVVFVTLKILGYITWSWWWVTLPLWGPLALLIIVGAVVVAVWGVLWLVESREE